MDDYHLYHSEDTPAFHHFLTTPVTAPNTQQVRGAIVAAGTSKAFVILGTDLHWANPEESIKSLMKGHHTQGLMDSHYQGNKVAVVWPTQLPSGFIFQFYQYDKASDTVLSSMECGNVAASCAAYALSVGIIVPDDNLSVHGLNEQTGQHILLTPTDLANPANCPWIVRFVEHNPEPNYYPSKSMLTYQDGAVETEFWAFEKGNAFIFARTNPLSAPEHLLKALNEMGAEHIIQQGGNRKKAQAAKIILYTIEGIKDGAIEVNSACRFLSEEHKSLPGSAAMALAGFLTQNHLLANPPEEYFGVYRFNMKHPSGYLEVQAHWAITDLGVQILATEFITPTAILMDGGFYMNGESYASQ